MVGAQQAPKRLSDWLLEQPARPDAYPLGLSWRVPEERAAQSLLKRDLLDALADERAAGARPLADWIRTLPVTGRVPVAVADARWLQANVGRDPFVQPHHGVHLPSRPTTVTVVTGRGERCGVTHVSGAGARAYLDACGIAGADWAWIAQPDGRVQRFGVASWNVEPQDEPGPGAWIWGPGREGGWSAKTSELLVQFLATQGPSDEPRSPRGQAPWGQSTPTLTPRSLTPFRVTPSDWGEVGLLQTPSARMGRAGSFRFTWSRVEPYSRGNVFVQPFDWLETGFRYSSISNRLYDPTGSLDTTQSNKDKSIDVKFRLWEESAYVPQVAVGLRDIAGTGLFSGEYVVANKRWRDFDFSLGVGWGYLGSRGDLKGWGERKSDVGEGGTLGFSSWFRGPAAFFGGVQYQTPWPNLILKAEYEGSNYQKEPQGNNQRQRTALNVGLTYRAASWADITLGVERGNTLMLGFALYTDLDRLQVPKVSDPPRVPVVTQRPKAAPDWQATGAELARQTAWHVERIEQRGREVRVTFADAEAGQWRERVDRAATVLNRDSPASVDRFVLAYRERGVTVAEHVVDRDAWIAQYAQFLPPHARREIVVGRSPAGSDETSETHYLRPQPRFEAGFGLDFQYTLGGPDSFLLYQLSALERLKFRFRDDTWLTGQLRLGLLNNYDIYKYTAPSNLPRVRTYLREYQTTSALTMPNLQITHVGKLGDSQYYSVYGGYLESMFAGVGAEWLYRPFAGRSAFGVDVNAVRQREFSQGFGFLDPAYRTVTGHATWYWDTGWNDVQTKISAGRYLAKDIGMTFEASRTFRNGVTLGAFFTKTNVSAAQFGEGSFDKGVYLTIPFDAIFTRSTGSSGSFVWKPLTRDGGVKLYRSETLYNITRARDERTLWVEPAQKPNAQRIPADRQQDWAPRATAPAPYVQVPARAGAETWKKDARFEHEIVQALNAQGFRNVQVAYDGSARLTVALAHTTLRPASRAVGRAARTAARLAPLEARELHVAFAERAVPAVRYEFVNLEKLQAHLRGALSAKDLAEWVKVDYLDPGVREADPLALIADLDTLEATPPLAQAVLPDTRVVRRVMDDVAAAGRVTLGADWFTGSAVAAGLIVSAAALDGRLDRFAKDRAGSRWMKAGVKAGDALPWIGMGAAGVAALFADDPRLSRTGYAAAEAGAMAFLGATGLKWAIGRARPDAERGRSDFSPFSTSQDQQSFPSRHAAVAWAVATPFAREYGANWLYGAAALTTLARIGSREHWASDAVAGSLLGYATGLIFSESSRSQSKYAPHVLLRRDGVSLAWALE